jgi:hypothetical protein
VTEAVSRHLGAMRSMRLAICRTASTDNLNSHEITAKVKPRRSYGHKFLRRVPFYRCRPFLTLKVCYLFRLCNSAQTARSRHVKKGADG